MKSTVEQELHHKLVKNRVKPRIKQSLDGRNRETGRKREQTLTSRGRKKRIGGNMCFTHSPSFIRDLNCHSENVIA